ncbi:unnamed protein product, partial [Ixodes persulcatus]
MVPIFSDFDGGTWMMRVHCRVIKLIIHYKQVIIYCNQLVHLGSNVEIISSLFYQSEIIGRVT